MASTLTKISLLYEVLANKLPKKADLALRFTLFWLIHPSHTKGFTWVHSMKESIFLPSLEMTLNLGPPERHSGYSRVVVTGDLA